MREITAKEFCDNMNDYLDMLEAGGNPMIIVGEDGKKVVIMPESQYKEMMGQLENYRR